MMIFALSSLCPCCVCTAAIRRRQLVDCFTVELALATKKTIQPGVIDYIGTLGAVAHAKDGLTHA